MKASSPEKSCTNRSSSISFASRPKSLASSRECSLRTGDSSGVGFRLTKWPLRTRRELLFGACLEVSGSSVRDRVQLASAAAAKASRPLIETRRRVVRTRADDRSAAQAVAV